MKHLYISKFNFGQNLMHHRIIVISIHTKAKVQGQDIGLYEILLHPCRILPNIDHDVNIFIYMPNKQCL